MVFPLFTGLVLSGLLLGQGGGFNRELGQKAKLNLSPPLVAPVRRELSRHCLPWETAIASTTAIAPAALSSAPLQRLTIWNLPPPERLSYPFLTSTQLEAWARQITVQIQHQGQSIGSGILVQVHGNQYTVLTSHHLFLGGESQYSVQTADGRKHGAVLLPRSATETLDLQLLQFSTPSPWYPVAPIGGAPWTQLNEPVAAAGFPIQYAQDAPLPGASGEGLEEGAEGSGVGQEALPRSDLATEPIAPFAFRPGVLSMVLAQPLEGGYQLGFTSDVFKGFSGGPLLNA
ncbi:S1 family peptidase, partial [Prochlorothrix hollandica]|uniref:S1 family peptidase n=1 Tax=Prochlorothrix hollandica TaxID=1223 RepID=UPI00333FFFAC